MKSMWKLFGLLVVLAMLLVPMQGAVMAQREDPPVRPEPHAERIPDEVLQSFEGGMTIDDFLEMNRGPIPNALLELTDRKVPVIVKVSGLSLSEHILNTVGRADVMAPMAQQAYVLDLQAVQAPLIAMAESLGGRMVSQYTKAFNGFQVMLPANEIDALRAQPGVVYVLQAKQYLPALDHSVPLINADDVWSTGAGYEGDGITIAVIDSGIDYYHEALGGAGNAGDYTSDDHTIIETGTFPTAKVIGGTDFAGTDYNASDPLNDIPSPDPDPVDEMGHGTHVASIAAGVGTSGGFGPGVAPNASLLAVKIFGACSTCTTTLTLDGIEYAMDPNGDGVMDDHVDVINMSLGSNFGAYDPAFDPELLAVDNATALGIVVAAAAGNAGDVNYIVSSPSIADSAISVAGSTTGYTYGPTVEVLTGAQTGVEFVYYPADFDDPSPSFNADLAGTLVDVDAYDSGAYEGTFCNTLETGNQTVLTPVDILDGKIALISRGGCAFSHKVNNAAAQGAIAVLIYNNEPGVITMIGDPVTIPAASVTQDDGADLQLSDDEAVQIYSEDTINELLMADPPDSIYPASSRGPRGIDSHLKPEITAPGMNIFAAAMGTGSGGVSYSGTSMSTPHIAGVAALLMEAHPDWTPEMIKAAMMNTAVDLVEWTPGEADVPRQGAGRVDALAAIEAQVLAVGVDNFVSLTFGYQEFTKSNTSLVEAVTLTNLSSTVIDVDLHAYFTNPVSTGFSFTGLPQDLTLPPNRSITVDVVMQVDGGTALPWWNEQYGYLMVSVAGAPHQLARLPFYIAPRPVATLTMDHVDNVIAPADVDVGSISVSNTGPAGSGLWLYPLLDADPNDPAQMDSGDLRVFGMDYGWYDGFDDVFIAFFGTYDDIYLPQPFYVEHDLYMDIDEDGLDEFVLFNYDYGAVFGGGYNNEWMVFAVNFADGMLYLASPYYIFSDFYAGFQEWYLADSWIGLDWDTPSNSDFDYQVYTFDMLGNLDAGEPGSFDFFDFILSWGTTNTNTPFYSSTDVVFWPNDQALYDYAGVEGYILVDYFAAPGTAQVYYGPIFLNPLYLPGIWND